MVGSKSLDANLEIVSPLGDPYWDRMVGGFENAEVFHKSQWAKVLSDTYGHKPKYIVSRTGPDVRTVLPVMEVNSLLTGKRGVSLPFTDCCPLLVRDDGCTVTQVLDSALGLGRKNGWRHLDLRFDRPISDVASSMQFYSHTLDISIGEARLLSGCASSVRRAIKKARNECVETAVLHGIEGAKEYYRLHCLTRKRHGLPPQPWKFFRTLGELCLVKESGFVSIASVAGRVVAGAIFLINGSRAQYKFGASDEKFLKLRGNNLVMWNSIERLAGMGVGTLCFGRTSLAHEGLRKFKLGWGCSESLIHYYRFLPKNGSVLPMKDLTDGLYNSVFRMLPISALKLVGQLAYRHQS